MHVPPVELDAQPEHLVMLAARLVPRQPPMDHPVEVIPAVAEVMPAAVATAEAATAVVTENSH
jgi:hypothetical protein